MGKRLVLEPCSITRKMRARENELFVRGNNMRNSDRQLDEVFERLYFHELDSRDKVVQRLQLPLVAFIALLGLLGHIVQGTQRTLVGNTGWLWVLVGTSALLLLVAAIFFVLSVVGHTYSFLPVPSEWLDYRNRCATLYEGERDFDKLVEAALKKGLVERYAECATVNGHINATKSFYVFMILRFLVAGAMTAVAAYAFFFFAGIASKTIYKVELVSPTTTKEVEMSNHKPPPPPPPPPSRQVKDDRSPPPLPSPPSRPPSR